MLENFQVHLKGISWEKKKSENYSLTVNYLYKRKKIVPH